MISQQPGAARYQQLAALLRARITSGELAPGAALPPEPVLMYDHDMARQTVRRALDVLRAEGLVETINGRGVIVRHRSAKRRVAVPRGARIDGRPVTADEALAHQVPIGSWMFVVAIGASTREYPQDTTYLTAS